MKSITGTISGPIRAGCCEETWLIDTSLIDRKKRNEDAVRVRAVAASDDTAPRTLAIRVYPWPNLFLRCCGDPRHLNWPLTMMAIRVHSASHSSILDRAVMAVKKNRVKHLHRIRNYLCEVNTMAWPLSRTLVIVSQSCRRATWSIPVVGSSRKTMAGSPTKATAVLNLRLFPPLRINTMDM